MIRLQTWLPQAILVSDWLIYIQLQVSHPYSGPEQIEPHQKSIKKK
jgi:hypothetical protein